MPKRLTGSGLILLFLTWMVAAVAEELTGQVVGVTDGDTLTLLVDGNRQVKARLAEIDALEWRQHGAQDKFRVTSKNRNTQDFS